MKVANVVAGFLVAATVASAAAANAESAKQKSMGHMRMMREMARYGGPVYTGAPALNVTASLVEAGGGPDKFSITTALTSMVGKNAVNGEVKKLTHQYGKAKVASWVTVFDYAVTDALIIATKAGVKLPDGNIKGVALAKTLVGAGLDKHNVFYTEYLLDKAVTHNIHVQVMNDIDQKYGAEADTNYHAITNQAMVDIAHALGNKKVKVAKLH